MKLLISTFILFIYQQLKILLFVIFSFYIFFILKSEIKPENGGIGGIKPWHEGCMIYG